MAFEQLEKRRGGGNAEFGVFFVQRKGEEKRRIGEGSLRMEK